MAKLSAADRAKANGAGCIPGSKVATIHATHAFMGEGYHRTSPEIDNSHPLADLGERFVVDVTEPVSGDQCNVWLDRDDPSHPWPRAAIPLIDLKPLDEAKAIIASMRYNQPKPVALADFDREFHKDLVERARVLGLDPANFASQEAEVRQLVSLCSGISNDDTNAWVLARMGRANARNLSVGQGVELTRRYLPCLETSGFGHKIAGQRVMFAKFSIKGDYSGFYGLKIQFDLDRGPDGKPADTPLMKRFRFTSVQETTLSWFEIFGIGNYRFD